MVRSHNLNSRLAWSGVIAFLAILSLPIPASAQYTWNHVGGGDWNNGFFWSPFGIGIPNSATATVNFGSVGVGTVNISSSVLTQSLTFSNPTGAYNLTSSAGRTLSGLTDITIGSGVTGIQTINLANVSSGSLLFASGSNLTITNNAAPTLFQLPTLAIGPNTVIGTPGFGGIIVTGTGSTTINGSFAPGANQAVGGITKTGNGILTLSGNDTNLGGGVSLSGGSLFLDYVASTATKLGTGALNLSGGTIKLFGNASTTLYDTAALGTTLGSGHTTLTMQTYQNGFSGPSIGIDLQTITRQAAGTLDVVLPNPSWNRVTTTTVLTNGIFGGWATYGSDTWATKGAPGTQDIDVIPYASYSTNAYAPGFNTDVTVGAGIPASFTTNTLRINGSVNATLAGTNTIQSGGILARNSSSNISTITGGTIASGTGELIVHAYSTLTIDSALSLPGGLTKTGTSPLILTGDNSGLTGPVTVNNGYLRFGSAQACEPLTSIRINNQNGNTGITFVLPDGQNASVAANISLAAISDTFIFNFGLNSRVTLGGTISTAAGSGDLYFLPTNSPTSGFNLTGTNTFTNNVFLLGGVLGIGSDASLGNAANQLTLTSQYSMPGLEFLADGTSLAHSLLLNGPSNVIVGGAQSNSIDSAITGVGSLTKLGTGTLTLNNAGNSYSAGTFVNEGRLMLGAGTAILAGTDVTVAAGAEFNTGGQSNSAATAIGSVVLNGGTLRASSGSGDYYVNQLQMTSGAVDFSGSTAFGLHVVNPAGITVNAGASSWIGGGTSSILNDTAGPLPITVNPGASLTAGIILSNAGANPEFIFTGGGAVRLTNTGNTANITVGTTLYSNDLSTNVGAGAFGTLGTGIVKMNSAGTLIYDGATATSAKPLTLAGNGTIIVPNSGVNLTLGGLIDESAPGATLQVQGTGSVGNPGTSTLTLLANNTYTGTTYVSNRAILAIPTITDGGIPSPIGASTAAGSLVLGIPSVFGRGDLLLTGTDAAYSTDRGAYLQGMYTAGAGGAIGVSNAATTLTVSGQLTGAGSFIKTGAGKLILNNATNNYTGGTYVEAGVLAFATGTAVPPGGLTINGGRFDADADAQLGDAFPTVNPAGTLRYTANASTGRTFNLTGGTLEAPAGVTIALNGATVNGGFLRGAGTFALAAGATLNSVTTQTSTTVNQTGTASVANFSNGGAFTTGTSQTLTWNGGTNTSSGRLTVTGTVNANDFVSNGLLTVAPGGVLNHTGSDMVLGGGSTTFVGSVANPGGKIDLGGQQLIVRGGFLVTNAGSFGSGNGVRNGTTVADYGALVKGTGPYQAVITQNGGQYLPGNSPGTSQVGQFFVNGGGNLIFEITDAGPSASFPSAPGTAGANPGWGLTQIFSSLEFTATPSNKFNIDMRTQLAPPAAPNSPGQMANFDPNRAYSWLVFDLQPGAVFNGAFNPNAINFITTQVANSTNGGAFSLSRTGGQVFLTFTPAPEPAVILGVAFAGFIGWRIRRRRAWSPVN